MVVQNGINQGLIAVAILALIALGAARLQLRSHRQQLPVPS